MDSESFINSVNLNQASEFPYLVLDVTNDHSDPRNPDFRVMHWHEDLQSIYVLDGTVQIKTLESTFSAQKGDGFFLNRNTVHLVTRIGACQYKSFLFPEYFLKFYLGSPTNALVEDLAGKRTLPVSLLSQQTAKHQPALEQLKRLSELTPDSSAFYYYEVLTLLCTLWLAFRKSISFSAEKGDPILSGRMKLFCNILKHITENPFPWKRCPAAQMSANQNVCAVLKPRCKRHLIRILRNTAFQKQQRYWKIPIFRLRRSQTASVFHSSVTLENNLRKKPVLRPANIEKIVRQLFLTHDFRFSTVTRSLLQVSLISQPLFSGGQSAAYRSRTSSAERPESAAMHSR